VDPVVRAYMQGVDRSLLRENLKLTASERLDKFVRFSSFAASLQQADRKAEAHNSINFCPG
jgi:hypothetical protein